MNDLSSLSDFELISEVKNGNFTAFENLVHRHDKQVLSIAARYISNAEDAKDIYQEVFLRVYKCIGKFRMKSEFTTWLYRITTNVCLTYRKKQSRHYKNNMHYYDDNHDQSSSQRKNNDSVVVSSAHVVNREISDRVSHALNLLSPQQKLIFMLKHYEGYKFKEIASFLKCTEGSVKKQLFTAIRRLRGELKDLYVEGIAQ